MYDPQARIRFWGGHLIPPDSIAEALRVSWRAPLMPNLDMEFRADIAFRDFAAGDTLALHPGLNARTTALNHPGNSIGYRIEWAGSSICYITDTEHPAHGLDQNLIRFVASTNLLIYDASFTDDEYKSRVGWGHSTWRVAADLADAAEVGQLVLFHHDPGHDDIAMDQIAQAVADRRPGSLTATEGMRLVVGGSIPA
jgi:phosphoribosyl 1,2-cyclic phosphodiesterase